MPALRRWPRAPPARQLARPVRSHAERRLERQLARDYETLIDEVLASLTRRGTHWHWRCRLPESIRGYGHVKLANLAERRRAGANCSCAIASARRRRSARRAVTPVVPADTRARA